jgi:beta-galactosidase
VRLPQLPDEFRQFLRRKYGTIEALNLAWGTAVWAQTYRSFGEIEIPVEQRPGWENPSARLDYYRYLSFIAVRFQHEQVEILREGNPAWLVMHNGAFNHLDYWQYLLGTGRIRLRNYPVYLQPMFRRRAPVLGGGHVPHRLPAGPGAQLFRLTYRP